MSVKNMDDQKKKVALVALDYINYKDIVGVGTGSTVNLFIEKLKLLKGKIDSAVASSLETEKRLKAIGLNVIPLNEVDKIPIYIDGADEVNKYKQLIKGGGGALTREKIIAEASENFICIVDETKMVDVLGRFPLPIEVIPMARSFVSRKIVAMKGFPVWRRDFVTDNGNNIIDVSNLEISEPIKLEQELNAIPGVVTNGLFANRPADKVILGYHKDEVKIF